jgi:hypothetical protein
MTTACGRGSAFFWNVGSGAETADQRAQASDGAPVMNGLLLRPPSRATSSELRRELLCNSVFQHVRRSASRRLVHGRRWKLESRH